MPDDLDSAASDDLDSAAVDAWFASCSENAKLTALRLRREFLIPAYDLARAEIAELIDAGQLG